MIRPGPRKYCYFTGDREQLFHSRDDPGEAVSLGDRAEDKDLVGSLKSRALADWEYKAKLEKYKRQASENRKAGIKDEP